MLPCFPSVAHQGVRVDLSSTLMLLGRHHPTSQRSHSHETCEGYALDLQQAACDRDCVPQQRAPCGWLGRHELSAAIGDPCLSSTACEWWFAVKAADHVEMESSPSPLAMAASWQIAVEWHRARAVLVVDHQLCPPSLP